MRRQLLVTIIATKFDSSAKTEICVQLCTEQHVCEQFFKSVGLFVKHNQQPKPPHRVINMQIS